MYELHSATEDAKILSLPLLEGVKKFYPIQQIKEFLIGRSELSEDERNFVIIFCNNFSDKGDSSKIVFGHFDIQPKNIAFNFDKGEINGIYDFGDAGFANTSYEFTKLAIQYSPKIVSRVLQEYKKLSEIETDFKYIQDLSIYAVLYCLTRDLECGRSCCRGLYELRLKQKEYLQPSSFQKQE